MGNRFKADKMTGPCSCGLHGWFWYVARLRVVGRPAKQRLCDRVLRRRDHHSDMGRERGIFREDWKSSQRERSRPGSGVSGIELVRVLGRRRSTLSKPQWDGEKQASLHKTGTGVIGRILRYREQESEGWTSWQRVQQEWIRGSRKTQKMP